MPPTHLFYHILASAYIKDYTKYTDYTCNISDGLNIIKLMVCPPIKDPNPIPRLKMPEKIDIATELVFSSSSKTLFLIGKPH